MVSSLLRRSRLSLGFPFACLTLVQGCLPFPERIYETPAITGQLFNDSVPVAGMEVSLVDLNDDATCEVATVTTVTDSEGRFFFDWRGRWMPYVLLLPVHQRQSWQLFGRPDHVSVVVAEVSSYTMGSGVRKVAMTCELSHLPESTRTLEGAAPWNDPLRPGAPCFVDGT